MSATMQMAEPKAARVGPKKPHTCRVCGRPTQRVQNGAGYRRTCSEECRRAAGHPDAIAEVLRQHREDELRGVPYWTPDEDAHPLHAIPRCVCHNMPVPESATGALWNDGMGQVHIL